MGTPVASGRSALPSSDGSTLSPTTPPAGTRPCQTCHHGSWEGLSGQAASLAAGAGRSDTLASPHGPVLPRVRRRKFRLTLDPMRVSRTHLPGPREGPAAGLARQAASGLQHGATQHRGRGAIFDVLLPNEATSAGGTLFYGRLREWARTLSQPRQASPGQTTSHPLTSALAPVRARE